MNARIVALGGLIALMGAGTAFGIQAQNAPPVVPAGIGFGHKVEKHPEIRMALRALNNAVKDLEKADHDFAGHREKALDLTQQAITECRAALQADKK
jgi:hypothetical protein